MDNDTYVYANAEADPSILPSSESPRSLWRNADFTLLLTGRVASEFGTSITTFAIPWLLLQTTGSGAQTGLAFAVGFIPYVLMSLPAGVIADTYHRRSAMMISDFVRLALLLSIPLMHITSGHAALWLLYIVQAGASGLSAFFDAAYSASLPNLVTMDSLSDANTWLQTSMSISRWLGPTLAGTIVALLGAANALLIDAASYAVSILTLLVIRTPFSSLHDQTTNQHHVGHHWRQGLVSVWKISQIRHLMFLSSLINFVGPGMDVALLYRIQHELRLSSHWAGIIMGGLSFGMFFGGLMHRLARRRMSTRTILFWSSTLQILPPLILACTKSAYIIVLTQAAIGVLLVAFNIQAITLRQQLVPNHLLGRCSSAFRLMAWISIPLGDAVAGFVSGRVGTVPYFIAASAVLSIAAVIGKTITASDHTLHS